MSGYRDLGAYDAPGVILSQIAGGRFSLGAAKDAVLNPEALAPEDRKTMAERLLDDPNGVSSLLINVATNPFVLAMLFTHAPAGMALRKGRDPFLPGKGRGAMNNPHNVLAAMSGLGVEGATMGAHTGPVIREVVDLADEKRTGVARRVGSALGRMLKAVGVDNYDPSQIRGVSPEVKRRLERMRLAEDIIVHRMWEPYEVRAQRTVATYGIAEKQEGKYVVSKILGSSDDGTNAAKAWRHHVTEHGKWSEEKARLWGEWRKAKDADAAADVIQKAKDAALAHEKREPARPFRTVKVTTPEKPDYTINWAPEGKGDELRAFAEKVVAEEIPEFRQYVEAQVAEKLRARNELFEIGADGLPSDRKAKVLLRGVQARMKGGRAQLEGALDGTLGSFGSLEGEAGSEIFFDKYHNFAVELGVQSQAEAMGELKKMIAGGEAMRDSYVPFNTFERVVTPQMRSNPNLRTADRSVLHATQEYGLKGGLGVAPGLVIPKTGMEPTVHPADWRRWAAAGGGELSPELRQHWEDLALEAEGNADRLLSQRGLALPALVMDSRKTTERYVHEANMYSVMTQRPTSGMYAAQKAAFRNQKLNHPDWEVPFVDPITDPVGPPPMAGMDPEDWRGHKVSDEWTGRDEESVEGLIRNSILVLPDGNVQDQVREHVAGLMGRAPAEGRIMRAAHAQAKQALGSFLGTKVGQWISAQIPRLGARLAELADPEYGRADDARDIWSGIARVFYMSHLGLNLGSMATNLMQPVVLAAPMLGVEATLRGYGRALKDMWRYGEERVRRFGFRRISQAERRTLLDEVLPHTKGWGIGPDILETVDSVTFGGRAKGDGGWLGAVEDFVLKGFEKTEWMNRMVTGHAVEALWEASGKKKGQALADITSRMVSELQFTNSPSNTPRMFLKGPLSNPALRMFMSFPVRTFTGVTYLAPMMGGQESYWGGLANTIIRGMGMSAVVYEVGKSLAGVDLSRGLFANSATDLAGGDKYLESGNGWIKLPPIVTVPHDFIAGAAQGDMQAVGAAVSRLIPGGVALNRAMGVMPDLGLPILSEMQRTTADWANPLEDGRVPVFKGGRLVDYKTPAELVMRGLGVDMGRFNDPGALGGYLVKQREEILNARGEYLRRLTANDHRGAEAVAQEFERRFKVPLTVSREQVRAFVQSRQVPREERILDRMPSEVRAAYGGILADSSRGLNVPRGTLTGGGTSGSRAAVRETPDAELERRVRAAMEQQLKGSTTERDPFGGFGTFGG